MLFYQLWGVLPTSPLSNLIIIIIIIFHKYSLNIHNFIDKKTFPKPVRILTTPFGTPASFIIYPNLNAESGVCSFNFALKKYVNK